MPEKSRVDTPKITVPTSWPKSIQAAMLHVIALAQYAYVHTRSWAANCPIERIRLKGKVVERDHEISQLRAATRIKDARFVRIPAAKRPRYEPTERLAILELRAARGWSIAKTAEVFQVDQATIASWCKRLDEEEPDALLQTPGPPVNKFPDFVRHAVQRLKALCPNMGKVKIAQTLARAGLHLAASSVGRIRKEPAVKPAKPEADPSVAPKTMPSAKRVTAKRPNHVWHLDLTVVPIFGGLWAPWLPFALPQCYPFCWWVGVVVDHYSRRALGCVTFKKQPTSLLVRQFLGRVIGNVGTAPKHLITDSGVQFTCKDFEPWCKKHNIKHRKGAIGQSGSIAVVERFIKTLKSECVRLLSFVPYVQRSFRQELSLFIDWFNQERPHSFLKGATPDEVYFKQRPANRAPRFEPRARWPRASPCSAPQTLVKGQPGAKIEIHVDYVAGRKHLPRITVTRAA